MKNVLWISILAISLLSCEEKTSYNRFSPYALSEFFNANYSDFETMRTLVSQIPGAREISIDDSDSSHEEITQLLKKLRFEKGTHKYEDGSIKFVYQTNLRKNHSNNEGVFFSKEVPQNYFSIPSLYKSNFGKTMDVRLKDIQARIDVDDFTVLNGSYIVYYLLTENWYLYMEEIDN